MTIFYLSPFSWSFAIKLLGHFRVPLCLCFKTSLSAKPFCMQFIFMQISHFHKNGFALTPEREAQGNSEMAYFTNDWISCEKKNVFPLTLRVTCLISLSWSLSACRKRWLIVFQGWRWPTVTTGTLENKEKNALKILLCG